MKNLIRLILLLLVCCCINFIAMNAQNSYQLSGAHDETGSTLMHEFDNDVYWFFEALPTGEDFTGNNLLRVTEFDKCGAIRSFNYTYPGSYGIIYFHNSFLEGDSLRIAMLFNARVVDHAHAEIGFLSINIYDLGHSYHYLRADNYLHVLSFFPTQSNKYFVHTFLSYTDRPIQYCSFLLDSNFKVERYFENFGYGTITGNAIEIDGGYFITTAKQIYKLDYELKPIWIKYIPERVYTRQIYTLEDGLVFRVILPQNDPSLRYEYGVVKTDFEGNLLWSSENFNFDNQKYGRIQLIKNKEENFELAVSKQYNTYSDYNKDMAIFTIDGLTGITLKKENSFNSQLVDSFRLKSYYPLKDGGRQLIIESLDKKNIIWNISNFSDCNLEEGANTFPLAPIIFEDASLVNSVQDTAYTGSYQWEMIPGQLEAEILCSATAELIDLLPDEMLICKETGWQVDLSQIPYDIIWADGNKDKVRQIYQEGIYQYSIDHCDIFFSESIDITVENCACHFYIPNIFSPDGNGMNDQFEVFNKCDVLNSFELSIFNRWGAMVYYSTDQFESWDGRFKGKMLNSGVYAYHLKYESSFNNKQTLKSGTITLIRNK